MKKLENFFDEPIVNPCEKIIECFEHLEYSVEDIADNIKDFDGISTSLILISALTNGNEKMADKIEKAMNINKNNRINAFKEAVANGTEQEFLSKMTLHDKISLECDMKLDEARLKTIKRRLTKKELNYANILDNSIDEDRKVIALSQGFNSVEEWQNNNSEVQSGSVLKLGANRLRNNQK